MLRTTTPATQPPSTTKCGPWAFLLPQSVRVRGVCHVYWLKLLAIDGLAVEPQTFFRLRSRLHSLYLEPCLLLPLAMRFVAAASKPIQHSVSALLAAR